MSENNFGKDKGMEMTPRSAGVHSQSIGDTSNGAPKPIGEQEVIKALQQRGAKTSDKMQGKMQGEQNNLLYLTSQIAVAYFQNNNVASNNVADVIVAIHQSLRQVKDDNMVNKKSVVNISDSLTPDYIICLEDGKKLKMLKRHLRSNFNMSPTEYRAKWGLPPDYPMVAPNYANLRSQFAKQTGLGKVGKKKV